MLAPTYSVQTTTLRAVRLFRIARLLRLIKIATGIRKILFSLIASLPAIFNIAVLLLLVIFIYAVIGMNLFGNLAYYGIINDVINFQTFANSMILMFRLITAVSWDAVLESLMVSPPDCDPNYYMMPDGRLIESSGGSCGNTVLAVIFMVTYVALVYLIITNMYIAVILENFALATEQEEIGVTEDDFEMFYFIWEKYDPHATQFIKYERLSDFVGELDEPLGIPKPNEIAIVAFDLNVYDGDRLHCLDILRALVKRVIGKVEDTEQFKELLTKIEQTYNDAFPSRAMSNVRTTTIYRKKEDVAAKTLQRAWRRHVNERRLRFIAKNASSKSGVDPSKLGTNLTAVKAGLEKKDLSSGRFSPNGGISRVSFADLRTPSALSQTSIKSPLNGGLHSPTLLPNGHQSPTLLQNGHANGHVQSHNKTSNGLITNKHQQNGNSANGQVINNTVLSFNELSDSQQISRPTTPKLDNCADAEVTCETPTKNELSIKRVKRVFQKPTLGTLIPAIKDDEDEEADDS